MELKLNIYKNQREIEKTYTTDSYDLMLGTCEDLLALLGLEKYTSEEALGVIQVGDLLEVVVKNFDKFIDLLHDIFPELKEEERRRIKIKELKDVFVGVAKHSINTLFQLEGKN